MGQSDIAEIIDYTAKVAAGIDGVVAVYALGTGLVDDPLRPGQKIQTSEENPVAAFTHWSEAPGAPGLDWQTQNKTVEVAWTIPMRLWLPKVSSDARRGVIPFYDRYLHAFAVDNTLGGLVNRSRISMFRINGDANWSWLDVGLTAWEIINYAT